MRGNVYGKCNAGRLWYFRVDAFMITIGFTRSEYYPCIYFKHIDHNRWLITGLVVDDQMIVASHQQDIDQYLQQLSDEFEGGIKIHRDFMEMTGVQLEHTVINEVHTVKLCQAQFVKKMCKRFGIESSKRAIPMSDIQHKSIIEAERSDTNTKQHWQAAGCLRWLSDKTRYDITFSTSVIASKQLNSHEVDQQAINSTMRYTNATINRGLTLGGRDNTLHIHAFADAAYIMTYPGTNQLAWCIFIGRDSGAVIFKAEKDKTASL